jgi:manganese-dependent ADP-ribose/CDP-alcohol diphosphatase
MDRESMQVKLGIPFFTEACGEIVGYHSVLCEGGVRFVVLDCYDIAKMRRPPTSSKYREADTILRRKNPNYATNENSPDSLQGLERRFVAFNGAVGPTQLAWLRRTLEEARNNKERVIMVSHLPLMPGSSGSVCLLWNYSDVLNVLREYADIVCLSLSGHAHKGGYTRDAESGIHFRVIEAVLENPHPHYTYATMEIGQDHIIIQGFGACASATYDLRHLKGKQRQ